MYILLYSSPRPYGACSGGRGRAVMSAARVRPNDACAQCGLLILWRAPVILTASYPPPYCGQLDGATVVVHSPPPPITSRFPVQPYHPFSYHSRCVSQWLSRSLFHSISLYTLSCTVCGLLRRCRRRFRRGCSVRGWRRLDDGYTPLYAVLLALRRRRRLTKHCLKFLKFCTTHTN